ncbi:DUF72 domain-containing protein [Allorhizocola rhizosphaerae]|uniref:DUF72 domain-containing protein n=1 Tax=Allorhizocola rhizosphaerae TaxID=1872709 RepID=UPI000E3E8BD0|nr:DUF72 domain-containing protein [Allorhizocola rhizosphaerae]
MLVVGTSGWQYRDWRGPFYPGAPSLSFYAGQFETVEVNNSFYRLPSKETFEKWRDETPEGFIFAVKMSRYLTHVKRLRDPSEPVSRFLSAASGLGGKLGPVLLQLPPTLRFSDDLDAVLASFPRDIRVAVEPRHRSWWCDEARELLEKHGAALCWADRLGRPITPLWRTSDFGYVRLHEGRAHPRPRYGRAALTSWLRRMRVFGDRPVYVYFNNDPGGAAIADAFALLRLAR